MINVFMKVEEAIIRTTARRDRSGSPERAEREKNYKLKGTGSKPVVVNADEHELIAQYFEEMHQWKEEILDAEEDIEEMQVKIKDNLLK